VPSKQTVGRTVAVVALLLLAGCTGLNGPTDTEATTAPESDSPVTDETSTVAETELPETTEAATTTEPAETTETPTTTAAEPATESGESALPPGVSDSGLENVTAVVAAHNESVLERGALVTGETALNGSFDGRTISSAVEETVRLAPGATELRWTLRGNTTRGNETTRLDERYYANGSTFFTRVQRAGDTSVRAVDRSSVLDGVVRTSATKLTLVNVTLSSANYTIADVTDRSGRTVTTLASMNGTYSGPQSNVLTFDATVTVSETGRVLSLRRSWTRVVENTTNRYTQTVTWSNATPVERPDWTANVTSDVDTRDASDERTGTTTLSAVEWFSSMRPSTVPEAMLNLGDRRDPAGESGSTVAPHGGDP